MFNIYHFKITDSHICVVYFHLLVKFIMFKERSFLHSYSGAPNLNCLLYLSYHFVNFNMFTLIASPTQRDSADK